MVCAHLIIIVHYICKLMKCPPIKSYLFTGTMMYFFQEPTYLYCSLIVTFKFTWCLQIQHLQYDNQLSYCKCCIFIHQVILKIATRQCYSNCLHVLEPYDFFKSTVNRNYSMKTRKQIVRSVDRHIGGCEGFQCIVDESRHENQKFSQCTVCIFCSLQINLQDTNCTDKDNRLQASFKFDFDTIKTCK